MANLRKLTPIEREAYALRYEAVVRPAIYARAMMRQEKTIKARTDWSLRGHK